MSSISISSGSTEYTSANSSTTNSSSSSSSTLTRPQPCENGLCPRVFWDDFLDRTPDTTFHFGLEFEFLVCVPEPEDFLTTWTGSKYKALNWTYQTHYAEDGREIPTEGHWDKRNGIPLRKRIRNYLNYEGIPCKIELNYADLRDREEIDEENRIYRSGTKVWTITSDGSISHQNADSIRLKNLPEFQRAFFHRYFVDQFPAGDLPLSSTGIELVSPILTWGSSDWPTLVSPLLNAFISDRFANSLFPSINETCGLHVHVEIHRGRKSDRYHSHCMKASRMSHLRTYICRNLAWIVYCLEPVIDLLHFDIRIPEPVEEAGISCFQSSRETISRNNLLEGKPAYEVFGKCHTHLDIVQLMNPSQDEDDVFTERFYKYNFRAREKHGTVEFRQAAMQFEEVDVYAWTELCITLMKIARLASWESLSTLKPVPDRDSANIEILLHFIRSRTALSDGLEKWIQKRAGDIAGMSTESTRARFASFYVKDWLRPDKNPKLGGYYGRGEMERWRDWMEEKRRENAGK